MNSAYFNSYVQLLTRLRLSEMIDAHNLELRKSRARPSLVVNPLTGRHYASPAAPVPASPAKR